MKKMYGEGSYFFRIHVIIQPINPWEDKMSSRASEDCKMKEKCEGDEITPSFFCW